MSNTTIKTLKTAKVGDKVTMLTFTGMNLGQFEVTKSGKTKIAIVKKDGTVAEFSRETGIQTNATNPKYANKVVDPMPEPEKKAPAKKVEAPKPEKKAPKAEKKVEKVEIPDDAEDFEDEDLDDDLEDDDFEEFDED
jgi:outer membrane biosynthesis protein TonB